MPHPRPPAALEQPRLARRADTPSGREPHVARALDARSARPSSVDVAMAAGASARRVDPPDQGKGRPSNIHLTPLVLVLALLVGGCGDAKPYQAALDGLDLPASWEVAKTLVKDGICIYDPYCPGATRDFTMSASLPDAFQEVKSAITAAGFGDLQELNPNCEARDTSGPLCSITARKGDLQMEVNLYPPGDDSLGLSVPDHPTVRVSVH
jgi:hypothetical protein